MDYPKGMPNVGLVGGKFVDENVSTGLPGSLIPATWGNAVTDELLAVIRAAGLVPSEGNNAQLLQAIQGLAASDVKRAVRVATTGPIALSGLQTIDGVALAAGDRVLVKDQANAAQNWIYTASANAWSRALDANEDAECTPGHLIIVQAGTAYAGTLWQLANTMPPQVGTTALTFAMTSGRTGVAAGTYRQVTTDAFGRVTAGANPTTLAGFGILDAYTKSWIDANKASLASPAFSGTPTAETANLGARTSQLANCLFVANTVDKAVAELVSALAKKADNASMLVELGKRLLIDAVSQQRPRLSSPSNAVDWNASALEIREAQQVAEWSPAETGDQWAPAIAFHWAGRIAGKLAMDATGVLKWEGHPLATLDSPVFTGAPRTDTAPYGDETGRLANTKFVQSAVRGQAVKAAKAWVVFNGTGVVAIRDSFNVSSVIDNGVGDYTVNFAVPVPNSNYAVAASGSSGDSPITGINCVKAYARTNTGFKIGTTSASEGRSDFLSVDAVIFSN